ncbi:MAG: hypothetical protein H7195_00560 [Chryseobacterium sp.]|nr:hypothetical protein [Chryseobacterium sp.]
MKILSFLFLTVFSLNFAQTKSSTKDNLKEKVENELKSGDAQFISFGIAMKDFKKFKEKIGVGLKTGGCLVTSTLSKKAIKNNKNLAKYLSEKYGEN